VLQDDVVVPPRSEVILPTNVQFQKLSTEAGKVCGVLNLRTSKKVYTYLAPSYQTICGLMHQ